MEAPEKLYLHTTIKGGLGASWLTFPLTNEDIEYIRTDAFIEKAKQWLTKNADNYTWYDEMEGESGMTDEFVDDFVNYMKGE